MTTSPPVLPAKEDLNRIIQLSQSPHGFLSVYLPTDPAETSTEGIRLRVSAMLDQLATDLAGTPLEHPFAEERKLVEEYARSLRPGGRGLAIISSLPAQEWDALWLPDPVEEHVRYGRGAYVLPLMDLLDEWEPVALAMVEKDRARLMVIARGRTEEVQHLETPLPERDSTRGRVSPRLQRSGLTREAGGGGAAGFQRHLMTHVENHLKRVHQELEEFHRRYSFRRLFLAGPRDTVALFRAHLSHELQVRLAGELNIDAYASDQAIVHQVRRAAREVERQEEVELVQEIITRAEKDQGAVTGTAPSLWAVNRHEMHLLVLAGESSGQASYCPNCDILLPPEDIVCPQCDAKPQPVDLWEELPGFTIRRSTPLEIVHGEAASLLWHHQSIGGLLKPVRH
jgi:SAM-dependent methyltransferase